MKLRSVSMTVLACVTLWWGASLAQTWPAKPITVVVGSPAGSAPDTYARTVAEHMSRTLGQPMIVENKAGAGANIAAEMVAKSKPDGYTILVGALSTHALNLGLYKTLPAHPLTGVENITVSSLSPLLLAVKPALPAATLAEFRDLLRRERGRFQYGSSGNGSTGHIAAALLLHQLGVEALHVPYRGSAPAFSDLAAGRTDFQVDTVSFLAPHLRQGTVRGLVIGARERSPLLPEVPSAPEAGLPQYEASTWTPWSAPKGTPAPVVRFLYEQIQVALRGEEVLARLRQLGNEAMPGLTPERTRDFIAAEIEKWLPIVRATGATVD